MCKTGVTADVDFFSKYRIVGFVCTSYSFALVFRADIKAMGITNCEVTADIASLDTILHSKDVKLVLISSKQERKKEFVT